VVAAAVAWGLVLLWPEHRDVWYLNDAAVHRSMVEWAAGRIRDGHLPFDGWYPYLSAGASRFHHYQSLPHIVTGTLSLPFGRAAFPGSLYLLLATWPISVYMGGRLLGLGRWPAAAAAGLAPFLVSAPGLGYEWGSYVWRGSGAWAQLWGMWLLPIALGTSWRAIARGTRLWLAALVLGLLIAAHLLTGYLALLCLGVFVLARPTRFVVRFVRAGLVAVGACAVAAWMLVPLIADASWAINDEFSRGTFYYDSFGAPRVGRWLVTGALFDAGRVPFVTVLVGVGFVVALSAWRREEPPRVLVGVLVVSGVLFSGRPTFGFLIDLLPGGADLFLRRYVIGVHLAGLYLAGLGICWLVALAQRGADRVARNRGGSPAPSAIRWAAAIAVAAIAVVPAGVERAGFETKGWGWIAEQRAAQATDGADLATLVRAGADEALGRTFGGKRIGPRHPYRVGSVPVYAALLNLQVDAIGFTRPTWSLVSGSEFRLDPTDPDMLRLFGVRSLVRPATDAPPPGAVLVGRAGRHARYEFPDSTYAEVVDTIAPIAADRTNLGERTAEFLRSDLVERRYVPTIAFEGRPAAEPTLRADEEPTTPAGSVATVDADPAAGTFAATVDASRDAVVLFKVSFDPRFHATVDGREAALQMLAPAFVGVPVPAGEHEVAITYVPFPWYGPLLGVGVLAVIVLAAGERLWRRRRPVSGQASPDPTPS
jgi:hypothetical protein